MKLRFAAPIALLLLLAAIARPAWAEEDDEAFKKELAALAGTWRLESSLVNGDSPPEEVRKEVAMTRTADGKIVGRRGETVMMEGIVKKLDLAATPKTIATDITAGDNKGKTVEGIYELDGDTLRICVALPGNPRPTKFNGDAGSNCALMVYKREKKEEE